ncbi:N-acetyl-D-Glu racemase DgcA [Thalassospira lucentensis]|uniref:N-acetyl-D-Glu racemase DgcA n=1 Tax=Thalassospira lucentensis TaxID=168935 RepID=UPI00142E9123|nr:N-acetyl-D-Glu racemase DgcA [Thalassospira lucentensis]NIZ03590.1 dipeptide epimerase [Thalassospira lucentensis]
MPQLSVISEVFPLAQVFKISRGARTEAHVVKVTLSDGEHTGYGECVPYARYDETVDGVIADIEAQADALSRGMTRKELQDAMKAGAARNAVDCAYWDLEAKRYGRRAWELAECPAPEGVVTAETLSIDTPDNMREAARKIASAPLLKVKLNGENVLESVRAVREGAPKSRIIVDANEAWSIELLADIGAELDALGVEMIEQPLPAGQDDGLISIDCPVLLCADESVHTIADIPRLANLYDMINIKLDKTGGLTGALELAEAATKAGLQLMTGCMVGTSLAMAPAMIIGAKSRIVDLDGPIWMAKDREHGLKFDNGVMGLPDRELWG